jgi:hypothetical protein
VYLNILKSRTGTDHTTAQQGYSSYMSESALVADLAFPSHSKLLPLLLPFSFACQLGSLISHARGGDECRNSQRTSCSSQTALLLLPFPISGHNRSAVTVVGQMMVGCVCGRWGWGRSSLAVVARAKCKSLYCSLFYCGIGAWGFLVCYSIAACA